MTVRCSSLLGGIAKSCENCQHIYDDSDSPEYGPPWFRCEKKPHMENLKGFPFKTEQTCFEPHWSLLVFSHDLAMPPNKLLQRTVTSLRSVPAAELRRSATAG